MCLLLGYSYAEARGFLLHSGMSLCLPVFCWLLDDVGKRWPGISISARLLWLCTFPRKHN